MRYGSKVDTNQPEIVAALQAAGAAVLDCHGLPNAFDLLVGFRGNLYIIEIKNPEYRPKRGQAEKMLTQGERKCMGLFQSADVPYHIVFSAEDALNVIGVDYD